MLLTYPPLDAYRRDAARLAPGGQFGPNDKEWLEASLLLQRYVEASSGDRRAVADHLSRYISAENDLAVCNSGLAFAMSIENAGAQHLAASWVALLERLVPLNRPLEQGRVLATRARLVRKFVGIDAAVELYNDVAILGEAHAEPELTSRAWTGYGVVAEMRGNIPEAKRWYHAAALVAEDNACIEPAFNARIGLQTVTGMLGDLDGAMEEGWRAFKLAQGSPSHEAQVLSNFAQILLGAGAHRPALQSFGAVVLRTDKPNVLLPALGGAALAGAALQNSEVVRAAGTRIEQCASRTFPYDFAQALLDLAEANDMIGDVVIASSLRVRALDLATQHGFHRHVYRAENPPLPRLNAAPIVFGEAAHEVLRGLDELESPQDLCGIV